MQLEEKEEFDIGNGEWLTREIKEISDIDIILKEMFKEYVEKDVINNEDSSLIIDNDNVLDFENQNIDNNFNIPDRSFTSLSELNDDMYIIDELGFEQSNIETFIYIETQEDLNRNSNKYIIKDSIEYCLESLEEDEEKPKSWYSNLFNRSYIFLISFSNDDGRRNYKKLTADDIKRTTEKYKNKLISIDLCGQEYFSRSKLTIKCGHPTCNNKIEITYKTYRERKKTFICTRCEPTFGILFRKEVFVSEKPSGKVFANCQSLEDLDNWAEQYHDKIRYARFLKTLRPRGETRFKIAGDETHHILPKHWTNKSSMYNSKWNLLHLSLYQHITAHVLLHHAYGSEKDLMCAFTAACRYKYVLDVFERLSVEVRENEPFIQVDSQQLRNSVKSNNLLDKVMPMPSKSLKYLKYNGNLDKIVVIEAILNSIVLYWDLRNSRFNELLKDGFFRKTAIKKAKKLEAEHLNVDYDTILGIDDVLRMEMGISKNIKSPLVFYYLTNGCTFNYVFLSQSVKVRVVVPPQRGIRSLMLFLTDWLLGFKKNLNKSKDYSKYANNPSVLRQIESNLATLSNFSGNEPTVNRVLNHVKRDDKGNLYTNFAGFYLNRMDDVSVQFLREKGYLLENPP